MKSLIAGAGLGLAALLSTGAQSQAETAPPQPSPKAVALARRYIADVQIAKTMEDMIPTIQRSMLANMQNAGGSSTQLPAHVQNSIIAASTAAMKATFPMFTDKMAVVYASVLSEGELQALVDFYESPVGRSVIARMPAAIAASGPVIREYQTSFLREMNNQLCTREADFCKKLQSEQTGRAPATTR